ncbi:hypothetical protein [Streptomyces sp. NPDC060184]|uniref:hypothetical protein n=1 Tax=Streptomyces sp. NPDC060184 TaxID=3347064 RepID=UPI0036667674
MTGPGYRDRVQAELRGGAPPRALDVAALAHEACAGDLRKVWGEVVRHLGRQPAAMRGLLLEALPERYARAAPGSGLRLGLLHLDAVLGRDLPGSALAAERQEAVAGVGDHWAVRDQTWLHLVHAELDAGRPLPPAAVASVRRTALLVDDPAWAALAARLTEPLLNVGENWSDAALADLAVLGAQWRGLVAHAATARTIRPTVKWERKADESLTILGEAGVREQILTWLSLVGRRRTLPYSPGTAGRWTAVEGPPDPHNGNVLRGLVLLLSRMGPDERTVTALGTLVDLCLQQVPDGGPRDPKLANAAVSALGRLGDPAALAELGRLASRTPRGNTRCLILSRLRVPQAKSLG